MRVLITGVTLVCILLAWLGHVWQLGQVHEEVGNAIEMTYAEKMRLNGFTGVEWKLYQNMKFTSLNNRLGMSGETKIKYAPQWMQATGLDRFWQRIEAIHLHADLQAERIDVVVAEVPRLDHLHLLYIGGEGFPEAKLAAMVGSIRLDKLHAPHAALTPGPKPWLRQTGLKELNLSHTQFSDAAVDDLPATLERLELEKTQLTGDGIARLARLKRLKVLILGGLPAEEETYRQLKETLPDCRIDGWPFETAKQKHERRKAERRERRLRYEREHGISTGKN